MEAYMKAHLTTLELNTRLFENCLDGVDDSTAQKRPSKDTNNMAFIAIHLVDARRHLAGFLGGNMEDPFQGKLDTVASVEDMKEYPDLAHIRSSWKRLSGLLRERSKAVTEADLAAESPLKLPIEDPTIKGALAFLLAHEAFHIGQLAFLRRYLGVGPMSYA